MKIRKKSFPIYSGYSVSVEFIFAINNSVKILFFETKTILSTRNAMLKSHSNEICFEIAESSMLLMCNEITFHLFILLSLFSISRTVDVLNLLA